MKTFLSLALAVASVAAFAQSDKVATAFKQSTISLPTFPVDYSYYYNITEPKKSVVGVIVPLGITSGQGWYVQALPFVGTPTSLKLAFAEGAGVGVSHDLDFLDHAFRLGATFKDVRLGLQGSYINLGGKLDAVVGFYLTGHTN